MKIKVLVIITVFILLLTYVPVYAETTLPAPPTDEYDYWVYMIDNVNVIYFIASSNPITVEDEQGKRIKSNGSAVSYVYVENKWTLHGRYKEGSITWMSSWVMVAANHDIAYEDGSGFFFECPKVSPLTQTMKGTDFGTILRNFSVGLIPIIGCLILVISLRKGWEFLQIQLKH